MPKNIIPIISMVIGVAVGGITVFIPEIVTELSIAGRLLAGLISGLMATGIWGKRSTDVQVILKIII